MAGHDIGSVVVKGSFVGETNNHARIYARGLDGDPENNKIALKSLTIGGTVRYAWVFAGVGKLGEEISGNAQIGKVSVGGDWVDSSLVAGGASVDGVIGDGNDRIITGGINSKIASIIIKGQVLGEANTDNSDLSGFFSHQIGWFSYNGIKVPLKAGAGNDTFSNVPASNFAQALGPSLFPLRPAPNRTSSPCMFTKSDPPRRQPHLCPPTLTPLPMIEPLEARIAPAVLIVNATTATYTDVDGDEVTIKFSTGTLNNGVFTTQGKGLGDQLLLINLSAGGWDGADLTLTVAKAATGDGVANLGAINSMGHDLGMVTIAGDLGQIDAGDATTSTTALELLKVRSMGVFGVSTQQAGGSLVSDINGPLDALVVTGDLHEATINAIANNKADGRIGSVTIGGSLIGSTDEANRTGEIQTSGNMGPVTIGGDVIGGASNMGRISAAFGTLASVTITGSVRGGSGSDSGRIFAGSTLGPVKIGGDLIGGLGFRSGSISSNLGNIVSVTIGGSVLGGGAESAHIDSNFAIGPVRIGGNVVGGQSESAQIKAVTTLGAVTIGGSLVGGAGVGSGYLSAGGDLGAVTIGGDVKGSSANLTGRRLGRDGSRA